MKQNLRVGEGYALSRHKLERTYIRHFGLLAVATTMCLYARAQRPGASGPAMPGVKAAIEEADDVMLLWPNIALKIALILIIVGVAARTKAQVSETPTVAKAEIVTPLQIGDTIPDELWSMPLSLWDTEHSSTKTIELGDYRNRLIILDFWATWCTPCIASMPKMDSLQRRFGGEVLIFPVTYEPVSKVRPVFAKHQWQLPTVVEDSLLKRFFPHKTVPHHVWIHGGKVVAATYPVYATEGNIQRILDGEMPKLMPKDQQLQAIAKNSTAVPPNEAAPLFQRSISKRDNRKITGFRKGRYGFAATNLSIPSLYRSAYAQHIPYSGWRNRIFVEVSTDARPRVAQPYDPLSGNYDQDSLFLQWNDENTYCYVSQFPRPMNRDSLYRIMQQDLDTFFGQYLSICGRLEKRRIPCLVLRQQGNRQTYMAKSGVEPRLAVSADSLSIHGHPMGILVERLATANRNLPTPIVDGTGYKGVIAVSLHCTLRDIQALNRELARYGLVLNSEDHEIDVLIIASTNH